MKTNFLLFISLSLLLCFTSCESISNRTNKTEVKPITECRPISADGHVNAIIEVPAGTIQKWEINKLSGEIEQELIGEKARIINYIGYPGNYGMIPQTLLPKEKGGDGDPLDILVLGPPEGRGSIIKCKVIGVLFLLDEGAQDDKLIAISDNSPLFQVNDISDLTTKYIGVSEIIKLWFINYKGPNKMKSNGFGGKQVAEDILQRAIHDCTLNRSQTKVK